MSDYLIMSYQKWLQLKKSIARYGIENLYNLILHLPTVENLKNVFLK